MKYISIKSVLNYVKVPKQEYDEGELLESAAQALRILRIPEQYEQKFCIATINEHRATLPDDLKLIEAVAYEAIPFSKSTASVNEEEGVVEITTTDAQGNTVTEKRFPPFISTSINHSTFEHTNSQLILKNIGLYSTGTWDFGSHYQIMTPKNDAFTSMYICPTHPDITCQELTYKILPDGTLLSSVYSGTILISYLVQPTDEFGDFLIPDDEDLKLALSRYVLWMFWEARQNAKVENSLRLTTEYRKQWQIGFRRVRGGFAYKHIDMDKLIAINERYINIARGPHVFNYLSKYYAR